jgi:hypothetical protein
MMKCSMVCRRRMCGENLNEKEYCIAVWFHYKFHKLTEFTVHCGFCVSGAFNRCQLYPTLSQLHDTHLTDVSCTPHYPSSTTHIWQMSAAPHIIPAARHTFDRCQLYPTLSQLHDRHLTDVSCTPHYPNRMTHIWQMSAVPHIIPAAWHTYDRCTPHPSSMKDISVLQFK